MSAAASRSTVAGAVPRRAHGAARRRTPGRSSSSRVGGAARRSRPGQFTMVYAFGAGEVPISISGDPRRPGGSSTRSAPSAPTTERALRRGRDGARGARPVRHGVAARRRPRARDVVVVAGGIGLAPLRPVVYELLARRERYGRVVRALRRPPARPAALHATSSSAGARGASRCSSPSTPPTRAGAAAVGVVTTLIPRAEFDPATAAAFVCGPEVMMRFSAAGARRPRGRRRSASTSRMERNMKCARRPLRPLPARPGLRLPRRPGVRVRPRSRPLLTVREL